MKQWGIEQLEMKNGRMRNETMRSGTKWNYGL